MNLRRPFLAGIAILLLTLPPVARAEGPVAGSAAPPFRLPWLAAEGSAGSGELFAKRKLTALVVWSRACPRCAEIATGLGVLADSLEPLGALVLGVVFGPDDPRALEEYLWDNQVNVPHLWDARGEVAATYGLGLQHLGVFLIDQGGIVRTVFDDKVSDLVGPILPAARSILRGPAVPAPMSPKAGLDTLFPASFPAIRVEGRMRFLSTEGAKPGDLGLFGEGLESGSLLLWRTDLRMAWSPARGVEFEPWLRFSNERDEFLTDGPEKLSSARGTVSLRLRHGSLHATAGAFPGRISPLLLQRWDAEDAPPLGGVSSCGCAGGPGLSQRSLELLSPFYTFEGASGDLTGRFARLRGWGAIPRWEETAARTAPWTEREQSHYRRALQAAVLDLGRTAAEDPNFGLPSPFGVRLGYLQTGDDARTIPRDPQLWQPEENDEKGWSALALLSPWPEFSFDGETVWWERRHSGPGEDRRWTSNHGRGYRAGARAEWPLPSAQIWGKVHWIRTGAEFDPLYHALTYDPNRVGWRASGGVRILGRPANGPAWLGLTGFYRGVRETQKQDPSALGRIRSDVASLTLLLRPLRTLAGELHLLRTRIRYPATIVEAPSEDKTTGLSLDLRYEGWPAVDPMIRLDALRRKFPPEAAHTVWQTILSLRVVG